MYLVPFILYISMISGVRLVLFEAICISNVHVVISKKLLVKIYLMHIPVLFKLMISWPKIIKKLTLNFRQNRDHFK